MTFVPWQIWAAAGLILVGIFCYWQIDRTAYERGRIAERQAAMIEAGKRISEMEKNNESFRSLSGRDRCILFMRDSGLPDKNCN